MSCVCVCVCVCDRLLAQPHQEHVHKVLLVAFARADVDLRVLEDFATEANVPGLKVSPPPPFSVRVLQGFCDGGQCSWAQDNPPHTPFPSPFFLFSLMFLSSTLASVLACPGAPLCELSPHPAWCMATSSRHIGKRDLLRTHTCSVQGERCSEAASAYACAFHEPHVTNPMHLQDCFKAQRQLIDLMKGPSLEVVLEEVTRFQKFGCVDLRHLLCLLEKVREPSAVNTMFFTTTTPSRKKEVDTVIKALRQMIKNEK